MAKQFTTIMMDKETVSQMRELKASVERWTGRSLSWGDFIKVLLAVYQARTDPRAGPGVLMAEMHQGKPMSEEELAEAGWEPDDQLTLQLGAALGKEVSLSRASCEAVAELVAEKLAVGGHRPRRNRR